MKDIFVRGVLFLLGGFLILHGLSYIAKTYASDGRAYFLAIDKDHVTDLLDHAQEAEAVVVGSSHGDDIDFSVIDLDGYQLSRAWGDFFEAKYYLEYLIPKLPNIKTVFLVVSFFSFDWDNAATEKLGIRREHLYNVIPSLWFIPGDIQNFIRGRGNQMFPFSAIVRADNWEGVVYGMISFIRGDDTKEISLEECEYLDRSKLADHAVSRSKEQIEFSNEIKNKHSAIHVDTYRTVVELVQFLQKHGIRVVFVTPPYYEEYTSAYIQGDPKAITRMQENMSRIQHDYGVEYYDFSADEEFISDHTLFKDADHLNVCGARLFSQKLNNIVLETAP